MRKLYLDDIRNPKGDGFDVVRSFDEAVTYCSINGCPSYISFDHDLGPDPLKTGFDFANWLVETDLDMEGNWIPEDFEFNVHSANPVGASNIEGILKSYLNFR